MKITRVVHGHGETFSIEQYHSIRIYNELEAELEEGDDPVAVQKKLFNAIEKLNQRDFKEFTKEK